MEAAGYECAAHYICMNPARVTQERCIQKIRSVQSKIVCHIQAQFWKDNVPWRERYFHVQEKVGPDR